MAKEKPAKLSTAYIHYIGIAFANDLSFLVVIVYYNLTWPLKIEWLLLEPHLRWIIEMAMSNFYRDTAGDFSAESFIRA